tara:strand:+ start:978 stop:1391 length:414 start_codon:yes stop_codon:yes gene_type:complete
MANEGRITIEETDGSPTMDLEPVILMEVLHRDDWNYRDINGYVRTKDIQTYGKIRQITLSLPIGAVTRSEWTQLNTWMNAGTQVRIREHASNSTYYDATPKYFFGYILSLDGGAYSEAKMSEPEYSVVIDVDRYETS